jgi:hypothetical protein
VLSVWHEVIRLKRLAVWRESVVARQAYTIEAQAATIAAQRAELENLKTELVNLRRTDAKRKARADERRLFAAPVSAETNDDATPGLQNPRDGKERTEFVPKRTKS